jgi:hypothetical protein
VSATYPEVECIGEKLAPIVVGGKGLRSQHVASAEATCFVS